MTRNIPHPDDITEEDEDRALKALFEMVTYVGGPDFDGLPPMPQEVDDD